MSGIAAVFHRNGQPAEQKSVDRIARSLSPYGPEKQVAKTFGSVGFAYAHFTNTPEARGQYQPVTTREKRYISVFDGRLDNRDDLGAALGLTPADLRALSDGALALLCWERWGIDGVNKWVGEFALIVWDTQEKRLTALRDQFGTRPLYYHVRENRLVLASVPKCIHAIGDIPREINENKIADALCQFDTNLGESYFKNISQLPPAHVLTITNDNFNLSCYYDLRDHINPVKLANDDDYIEAARELLETSVTAMMRSPNKKVGSFMSGGFDSSTSSIFAAKILGEKGQRLTSFTSIPEAGWDGRTPPNLYGDETPYVKAICDMHPNIDLNLVDNAGRGQYDCQEALLMAADGPTRNALNVSWIHAILEQAQNRDIKVMLDGTLGNMTYSYNGAGLFNSLWENRKFGTVLKEIFVKGSSPTRTVKRAGGAVLPFWPDWAWHMVQNMRGMPRGDEETSWLRYITANPDFARSHDIKERAAKTGFNFFGRPPKHSREYWVLMFTQYICNVLPPLTKAHQSMFGIEVRDPFANRKLVEWCLGVPEEQFKRDGVEKFLIRRLMKDQLPQSVLFNPEGKGRQTPDWHLRMSRDMPRMKADLEKFRADSDISRMVNVDRLQEHLDDWPDETIVNNNDYRSFFLPVNLPMGLQMGRFVEREKGTNT